MLALYSSVCAECSRLITRRYSTSFSSGIHAFAPEIRMPVYSLYGFVRLADEIVDTFFDYPQAELFECFRVDTWKAIEQKISLNPVLHAFQEVVHTYQIDPALITAFLDSMEMDLHKNRYEEKNYNEYIYGSAEVVGLMCLQIFCKDKPEQYEALKAPAQRLGAAFQKINFLRDMKSDFEDRGRVYFPNVDFSHFSSDDKKRIEAEIEADFKAGYQGILSLPKSAQFGVYLAYRYFYSLFKKICRTSPEEVSQKRIRVHNAEKLMLFFRSSIKMQLNLL